MPNEDLENKTIGYDQVCDVENIDLLIETIDYHNHLYYVKHAPEITDFNYDALYKRLVDMEKDHPINPNSPTQRVGSPVEGKFQKVTRKVPMLSLDNCYDMDSLEKFINRALKFLEKPSFEYTVEPKIDGVSIELTYKEGLLISGVTRGDGKIGENITSNIRAITDIPLALPKPIDIVVRGEIFMTFDNFNNLEGFKNPRNATAGTLHSKDPSVVMKRNLSARFYEIVGTELSQEDSLYELKDLNIPIPEEIQVGLDPSLLKDIINNWKKPNYPVDGVVIKLNKMKDRKILGANKKFPLWAIAYKFQSEQQITTLTGILQSVGRTGAITPVAQLKPVLVSGSTISNASLYNWDMVKKLELRIGDEVIIEKAGEVIPKIVSVHKHSDNPIYHEPIKCPSCNTSLIKKDLGDKFEVAIRCPNYDCKDQVIGRISHFVSKRGMDIDGMGDKIVEKLVTSNLIKKPSDIYRLKYEDLIGLDKMGDKSIANLLSSIEQSKTRPLANFIYSLGIHTIGRTASEELASKVKCLDNLELDYDKTLDDILNLSFTESEGKLTGMIFCITGTLPKPRKFFETLIKEKGGKLRSSISKNLDYLIVGNKPGSKVQKAQKVNVPIISLEKFHSLY